LTERGLGIPLVLVLVEGGYDAIDDVHTSLENKVPVVVCAGTGRAADIIAYAYDHMIVEKCVLLQFLFAWRIQLMLQCTVGAS
jgi:SLOG in TRPM